MKPATHRGSCQACGSVQKLPGGVLSKHGYTTRWGFFEGTCPGSGERAFEVSKDLIERFIASAKTKRDNLRSFAVQLRKRPTEPKAWFEIYDSSKPRVLARSWVLCDLAWDATGFIAYNTTEGGREIRIASYMHPIKKRLERIPIYGAIEPSDLLWYGEVANQRYATVTESEVKKIQDYIDWQARRAAEWKPTSLLPLEKKTGERASALKVSK